jgi:protein-S-isoprenylcysteine O-methyltransferase Ste14
MSVYSVVLFVHLLALLVAVMAFAVAFYAALQLRDARTPQDAARWGRLVGTLAPAFPVASLTLLGTGAYMTQDQWTWATPWIDAGMAGLALITICGAGVEASRGRALKHELMTAGMSARARRLQRDPYAWSAKMTTLTLMLATVFVMAAKPGATGSFLAIALAVAAGIPAARPFWSHPAERSARSAPGGLNAPPT